MSLSFSNGEINRLPQLVLLNVFDFLNRKNLLTAASVCKRWREIILSLMKLCLWTKLVLNIKPPIGIYGKGNHGFHLLMCAKYAVFTKHLVIYVCQCQQENLNILMGEITQVKIKPRLQSIIIRKACLNKCCRSKITLKSCGQNFGMQVKLISRHFKCLQQLSFGFDCDLAVLDALSEVYSNGGFGLKVLNAGTLSDQGTLKSSLSWLCELHEVTVNIEMVTESLLQSWLEQTEKFNLKKFQIIVFESVVKGSDLESKSPGICANFTDVERRFDWKSFELQESWHRIHNDFPSLKVQLLLVATSMPLSNILQKMPVDIPVNQIVVIFRLQSCPQTSYFRKWLLEQNFTKLESLVVHGIEPLCLRLFDSQEGEEWLDLCCNSLTGIKEVTLSGMYVSVHELLRCVAMAHTLEDFHISKHDLLVNSLVQNDLQLKVTTTHLRNMEIVVSLKLGKDWKADKGVPIQYTYRHKCPDILDIARLLLNKYENNSMNCRPVSNK